METFIKKLCSRYKVSEADVQSLLDCMEEVHFKKRELIVREGTKNSNLYFIRNGIWRAYYHKDGEETTIWFASDGEAAFSVWGYVDNAYSLVNIQAMCDSVAYCISRAALNQLSPPFTYRRVNVRQPISILLRHLSFLRFLYSSCLLCVSIS